jgi:DNA-binding CsgD family transcriptional regulator
MFGSEMKLITFVIIIIECFIAFNFIFSSFQFPENEGIKRFVKLTICMLCYNFFSGIFPDYDIQWVPMIFQHIISYAVGIIAALYYVNYLYSEYDINEYKLLSVKSLLIAIVLSFIVFFIVPLVITSDLILSKKLFIYIPIAIGIYFLARVGGNLYNLYNIEVDFNEKHYRLRIISVFLALLSIVAMPIIVSFGDYQTIELLAVNFGFLVLTFILLRDLVFQEKKRTSFLKKMGYIAGQDTNQNISIIKKFNDFELTQREIEIGSLILENKTYKKISDTLFIAEGTVSKHASNIYKKTNARNKDNFICSFK